MCIIADMKFSVSFNGKVFVKAYSSLRVGRLVACDHSRLSLRFSHLCLQCLDLGLETWKVLADPRIFILHCLHVVPEWTPLIAYVVHEVRCWVLRQLALTSHCNEV